MQKNSGKELSISFAAVSTYCALTQDPSCLLKFLLRLVNLSKLYDMGNMFH